jgi:hypothetical protein
MADITCFVATPFPDGGSGSPAAYERKARTNENARRI